MCHFVMFGLQVGRHVDAPSGEPLLDRFLDPMCLCVRLFQRTLARQHQVILHPELIAGATMPELVIIGNDPLLHGLVEHLDQPARVLFVHALHQAGHGLTKELKGCPKDVERHDDRDQWVQPDHPGPGHQGHADHHAQAGPHVREHMAAVGFQHEAVVPPPHADQVKPQQQVDQAEQRGQQHAQPQPSELRPVQQVLHGRVENTGGGQQDHGAFEAGREVGNLAVPVGVIGIGRLERIPEAEGDERRGQDVHERLGGIRKDRGASREQIGGKLPNEHQHRHRQAGRHCPVARIA